MDVSRTTPRLPRGLAWLVPALLVAVLLAVAFQRAGQVGGQDEVVHYVRLGERLAEDGFTHPDELITFSPHLYGFAIWGAHALGGPGLRVARLPGLAAWGLTALLLWWSLVRRPLPGAMALAAWMLAGLVTTPLASQAAAIVDIDNTILVPAVLMLCLGVARYVEHPGWPGGLAVTALLTLALWCRVTTPTLLLPAFLLYAGLRPTPRRGRVAGGLALWLAAGVGAFLLTWWGYCRVTGVSFAGPFDYLVRSFIFCTVGEDRGIRPGKIALTLIYVLFWVGPALACLWAWLGLERLRRLWRTRVVTAEDLFLGAAVAVLGGYCLVGGTIFGFPKYHCPALPLLFLALAGTFAAVLRPAGRAGWQAAVGLALAGAFLQVQILGDPLLVLRLDLREAVYLGASSRAVLWTGLLRPALVAAVLAVPLIAVLCRRRLLALPCALLCLGLGMNAGMLALQLAGGYQTGYNYGDAGDARAVAAFLARNLPPDRAAMVPGEVVYLLGRPAVRDVPNELWCDPVALRHELERPDVGAAASSLLTNTMVQLDSLISVADTVPGYQRLNIGRYTVFLRTDPP
jgi:hypothetical protein